MCAQALPCAAHSSTRVEHHHAPGGDVRGVSARKPAQPLDLPPPAAQAAAEVEFLKLQNGAPYNDPTLTIHGRLLNQPRGKDVSNTAALVLQTALSVLVLTVALAVSPDTCTTASSHQSVLLAALCFALATLTVTTRCYASTASASATSEPLQTLSTPSTSLQTLPRSIAQPQTSVSRSYSAVKRTSTAFLNRTSRAGPKEQITLVQTLPRNASDTAAGNSTSPGDISAGASEQFRLFEPADKSSTVRPMPPVHDEPTHTVNSEPASGGGGGGGAAADTGGGSRHRFLALVISAALVTVTLGLITTCTCVLNYCRGDTSAVPATAGAEQYVPVGVSGARLITASMLSVVSASAAGMDAGGGGAAGRLHRHVTRELAVQRDRQVRLHSVHTDLQLDLPPSIALPDGEELPYGSSARLHIRDAEQESEIYQKCIRPPPNRTVFESESPPPYRSSSAGLLGSLGATSTSSTAAISGSDWSTGSVPFVVRCHSMSSTSTTTTTNKRTHEVATASSASSAPAGSATGATGGPKTDFLQRTVKIFTSKKNNSSQLPQPAPTLPAVVVPTSGGVRVTRRLAAETTAPTRTKPQSNV